MRWGGIHTNQTGPETHPVHVRDPPYLPMREGHLVVAHALDREVRQGVAVHDRAGDEEPESAPAVVLKTSGGADGVVVTEARAVSARRGE